LAILRITLRSDRLRAIVVSAVMAALALTLPIVFHAAGLGSKFLPMLLPLLLNAFLVPWPWAVLTGAVVPWISAFTTGMPPLYPPVAMIMSCEAAVMAAVAAFSYRATRPRVWPALILAILSDRVTSFALTWWLAGRFGLPAAVASWGALAQSLPGVALQLVVVPLVIQRLSRRPGILFRHEHQAPTLQ
jgi:hypothetical protein